MISIVLLLLKVNLIYKSKIDKEPFDEILKEFKNSSQSQSVYYILFVIRRFLISIMIVFVNEPVLQVIICFILGFIVRFIQVLVYLIVVRPFKCYRNLVFHVINESLLCGYNFILLIWLFEGGKMRKYGKVLISLIVAALLNNLWLNLYEMVKTICGWIQRKIKSKVKIGPDMNNETGDVNDFQKIKT